MSGAAHVHPADFQPIARAQAGKAAATTSVWVVVGAVAGGLIAVTTAIALAVVLTRPSTTTVCAGIGPGECTASLTANPEEIVAGCDQDIGLCSSSACDSCDMCCGAAFESQTADCTGESVVFSKVVSCSCVSCDSREISISGRVAGACTSECEASIRINGVEVAQSDSAGYFTFRTTLPSDGNVNFEVFADSNTYFPQAQQVQVSEDSQSYVNVQVPISALGTPTVVNVASGATVPTTDFEVNIPPNSITTADGTPVTGDVNVYVSAIETSTEGDLDAITVPSTATIDGQTGVFISDGMMMASISSVDDPSAVLQANGVTFTSTTDNVPTMTSYVWKYNDITGSWERLGDVTRHVRYGRDGIARNVSTATLNLSSTRRLYNLDAVTYNYCYLKVKVFVNDGLLKTGVTVKAAYYMDNDKWGGWMQRTSARYGVCLQLPCNKAAWPVARMRVFVDGYTLGTHNADDSILSNMNYNAVGTTAFRITVPTTGDIPYDESGRPFYKYWSDCYKGENYFKFTRISSIVNSTSSAGNATSTVNNSTSGNAGTASNSTMAPITITSPSFNGSGSVSYFRCRSLNLGVQVLDYFDPNAALNVSAYTLSLTSVSYKGAPIPVTDLTINALSFLSIGVYSVPEQVFHNLYTSGSVIRYQLYSNISADPTVGSAATSPNPNAPISITVSITIAGNFTINGDTYNFFVVDNILGSAPGSSPYTGNALTVIPGVSVTDCFSYTFDIQSNYPTVPPFLYPNATVSIPHGLHFNYTIPSFFCTDITLGAEISNYFHPTDPVDGSLYSLASDGFIYDGTSATLQDIILTTPPFVHLQVYSPSTGVLHVFSNNETNIIYQNISPPSNVINGVGITTTVPLAGDVTVLLTALGGFSIGGSAYLQFALGNFTAPANYEQFGTNLQIVPGLTASNCHHYAAPAP